MTLKEIIKQAEKLSPEEKQELTFYLLLSSFDYDKKEVLLNLLRKNDKKELKERPPGFLKGNLYMSKDFDEPIEEFKEYM